MEPEPGPWAPQPSAYLLVHGPLLGAVAALGPVAAQGPVGAGSLAEALLGEGAVVRPLLLAGAGVGDGGAVHELSVFGPVVKADPAAALALGREGTGCSCRPGRGGASWEEAQI